MTIRIDTRELLALLGDLVHTAAEPEAGAIGGVLLHVARGYPGVEPGRTTLLVGTSTTGRAVGHTHTWCSGTLGPMLWPVDDAQSVIAVLKPLARRDDNHAVEIHTEDEQVVVSEDPDLFEQRTTLSFALGKLADYPRTIWSLLTDIHLRPAVRDAAGDVVPAQPRTDLPPASLAPFLAIAKRRKAVLELHRYHQRLPVLVQIGTTYTGAVLPSAWPEGADGNSPTADVYAPELPAKEVSATTTTE